MKRLTTYTIRFGGHELWLTDRRALYWPGEQALVLADLHLGKAAHFRRHGIALPSSVSDRDLQRLHALLDHFRPKHLVVVGDFSHAGANAEVERFAHIAEKHADTCFTLVRGNHDRLSSRQLAEWGFKNYLDTWQLKNIRFAHEPIGGLDHIPTISGHLHPGVRIPMPHKRHVKLPCYVLTGQQLILPAFSLFTGLDTASVPPSAICYAIYDGGIIEVGPQ